MRTVTLLDFVNEVLLNIGEFQAPDFDGVVSTKARVAVQASLLFVANTMRWPHLRSVVTPSTWLSTSVAVLPEYQSIRSVRYNNSKVDEVSRDYLLDNYSANEGTPRWWCPEGASTIRLNPTKVAFRPGLTVDLILLPTVPLLVSDNMVAPEPFLNCVRLHAEAEMHRVHTADDSSRAQALQELERQLQLLRTRAGSDRASYWRF